MRAAPHWAPPRVASGLQGARRRRNSPAFPFPRRLPEWRPPTIVEIQCLPSPAGDAASPFRHIEAAIAVIQGSGLHYEVGALGTTIEGDPDAVWAAARAAHEACLVSGARGLVTVLKVEQTRGAADQPTIASLTGKFR